MTEKTEYMQRISGLTAEFVRTKLLNTLCAGEQITEHQRKFLINALHDMEAGRHPAGAFGITGKQGKKVGYNLTRNFEIVRNVRFLLTQSKDKKSRSSKLVTSRKPKAGNQNVFEYLSKQTNPTFTLLSEEEATALQPNQKMAEKEFSKIPRGVDLPWKEISRYTAKKALSGCQWSRLLGHRMFFRDNEVARFSIEKISASRLERIYYDSRKLYDEYLECLEDESDESIPNSPIRN